MMPNCRECKWLVNIGSHHSVCSLMLPSGMMRGSLKLRAINNACKFAIFLKYLPQISGDVLEIGSGGWSAPQECLTRSGTRWTGLDPKGKKWGKVPNYVCAKVGNIPLPDDSYDWVITFSAIEHWSQHGDTVEGGLAEIARVLKPGGRVLIDASFGYRRTTPVFLEGRKDDFLEMFDPSVWKEIVTEEWRRAYSLPPLLEKKRTPPGWELEVLATRK